MADAHAGGFRLELLRPLAAVPGDGGAVLRGPAEAVVLEILAQDGAMSSIYGLSALTNASEQSWGVLANPTAQWALVSLPPRDCYGCTIRLLRQAIDIGGPTYTQWSCADVNIMTSGVNPCHNCAGSDAPCALSAISEEWECQCAAQIEVAIAAYTTSYVAVGWRPIGLPWMNLPHTDPASAKAMPSAAPKFPPLPTFDEPAPAPIPSFGTAPAPSSHHGSHSSHRKASNTSIHHRSSQGRPHGMAKSPQHRGDMPAMYLQDMTIASARGNYYRIQDAWTNPSHATPIPDTKLGGTNDILDAIGHEEPDGMTFVKFRRPFMPTDTDVDYQIRDMDFTLVWARGQAPGNVDSTGLGNNAATQYLKQEAAAFYRPDELKYHGRENAGSFGNVNMILGASTLDGKGCAKTKGWVALGFSPDGKMVGSDAIVGFADSQNMLKKDARSSLGTVSVYKLTGYSLSQIMAQPNLQVENASAVYVDKTTILRFARNYTGGNVNISVGADKGVHIIWATSSKKSNVLSNHYLQNRPRISFRGGNLCGYSHKFAGIAIIITAAASSFLGFQKYAHLTGAWVMLFVITYGACVVFFLFLYLLLQCAVPYDAKTRLVAKDYDIVQASKRKALACRGWPPPNVVWPPTPPKDNAQDSPDSGTLARPLIPATAVVSSNLREPPCHDTVLPPPSPRPDTDVQVVPTRVRNGLHGATSAAEESPWDSMQEVRSFVLPRPPLPSPSDVGNAAGGRQHPVLLSPRLKSKPPMVSEITQDAELMEPPAIARRHPVQPLKKVADFDHAAKYSSA
eukprot:SM000047S16852  [mRNA]  locus=s47:382588:389119:+ [translate_table: standard]